MTRDIVSLGECMVELYADGPLAEAATFHRAYGGDTLNTLVAAARLGATAAYVTNVGDDPFADYLLSSWQAEGIDTSGVRRIEGWNGLYFIALKERGERDFVYYRAGSAASRLAPDDLPIDLIRSARVFHVSGISQAISPSCRQAVLAAVRAAKDGGALVSFDPNYRSRLWSADEALAAMEEVLPYVDIALPSAPEEMQALTGLAEPDDIADYFLDAGARYVGVKLGEAGCYVVATGEGALHIEAPQTEVRDTTGAGDAFNGAFLYGILHHLNAVAAAKLGVVVSAASLTRRGAIGGLPQRHEAARLAAQAGVALP